MQTVGLLYTFYYFGLTLERNILMVYDSFFNDTYSPISLICEI